MNAAALLRHLAVHDTPWNEAEEFFLAHELPATEYVLSDSSKQAQRICVCQVQRREREFGLTSESSIAAHYVGEQVGEVHDRFCNEQATTAKQDASRIKEHVCPPA